MLKISSKIPTKNLPIKRVLAKLTQSFIYTNLDDKEHKGEQHSSGKIFKALNFRVGYYDYSLTIEFTSLDPQNERRLAQAVLTNGLKLGEVIITDTSVQLIDKTTTQNALKVKGFVAVDIKDGKNEKRKIYIEPKTSKFQEIIKNSSLQKYETFFNEPYQDTFEIEVVYQKENPKLFFYSKQPIKSWFAIYHIKASSKMLNMLLAIGMGKDTMKNLGFLEVVA